MGRCFAEGRSMTPDEARAMGEAAAKCVQIASMTRQELADYCDAIK